MTKFARVIFFLGIIFINIITVIKPQKTYASFGDLMAPSVSFGDLLGNDVTSPSEITPTPTVTADSEIYAKTARYKELLAKLEKNYKETLAEFKAKQETIPRDLAYDMAHPSPTPVISVFPTPATNDQILLASLNTPANSDTPLPSPQPTINNLADGKTNQPSVIGNLAQNPPKMSYSIALLGDSMTDTLGKSLPHLRNLLQSAYPTHFFSLINYGQGATDMEKGLYRLTNTTNYLGADYPPLLSYKPDILVVESFAYNHWSGEKYDLDRQWVTIAKIIDTVKANSPDTKIILAASIAPNKDVFGDGILNWPKNLKEQSSYIIKAYLQNMINFATSEHYPLADAYNPSLSPDGNGNPVYINSSDHLHPSNEGAYLYSFKIFAAIKGNNLIQ